MLKGGLNTLSLAVLLFWDALAHSSAVVWAISFFFSEMALPIFPF
jgi:hypothetical protein